MDITLLQHRVVCSATARHLFLLQTLMNSACRSVVSRHRPILDEVIVHFFGYYYVYS